MRITLQLLLASLACLVFTSCASVSVQTELAKQFIELQDAGKIPGCPPGRHGFQTQTTDLLEYISYPYSRRIYMKLKNDPAHYTYVFVKDSKSSPWRLTTAWRTMPDGRKEDLKID